MTPASRPRAPLSPERFTHDGTELPSELEICRTMHERGRPGLTLAEFVSAAWEQIDPDRLVWSWHMDAVCAHAEALVLDRQGPSGQLAPQNLLINVPPGTSKSLIVSVFLPAWVWLFRPAWRAIFASGTPRVVTRDSLKCRTLIKSEWYQKTFTPTWEIARDQDEKQHFATSVGGFRKGTTAGATVTGERADFLAVDDPNDAAEVHSKAHREAINERWWASAFRNRVASPEASKRIVIMQRLHEEDLAGFVLARETGAWGHLCLPMEFAADAPGDRPTWIGFRDPRSAPGEILSARFTPAYLAAERKALGSSGYAGQMDQRPYGAEGNRFLRDWWRFYAPDGKARPRPAGCSAAPPRVLNPATEAFDELIGSVDCAFKGGPDSDFVVGIIVGRKGADKFVVWHWRKQAGFSETQQMVLQMRRDWPRAWEILIEDKANGSAVIETLRSAVSGIIPVNPQGGKEARAAVLEPQVEGGNWYLPEGAEWLADWIDEFAAFPKGRHDDQVDVVSQVAARMIDDPELESTRALLGIVSPGAFPATKVGLA